MQSIEYQGVACLSLKQLDELNRLPKGTSFRIFKHTRPKLQEGVDYFYLPAAEHADFIEQLRGVGAIYSSSTHLLLITRAGYTRMQAQRYDSTSPQGF
jgi:hypothetical protein